MVLNLMIIKMYVIQKYLNVKHMLILIQKMILQIVCNVKMVIILLVKIKNVKKVMY